MKQVCLRKATSTSESQNCPTENKFNMIIPKSDSTQKSTDEVDELRVISSHMLRASRVQIPQNNLDNLQSIREEDGTLETVDPQDCLGSLVLEVLDFTIIDLLLEPTDLVTFGFLLPCCFIFLLFFICGFVIIKSQIPTLPSNTVANPRGDLKAITTQSGVSYDGPTIPTTSSPLPKEVEREPEVTKDKVQTTILGSTAHIQPSVVQVPIQEPEVVPKPNPKPSISYPSRINDQKLHEKANYQMLKSLQIFQRLHFDLSFADALLHIPKFASTFKSLLSNKEKLYVTTVCCSKLEAVGGGPRGSPFHSVFPLLIDSLICNKVNRSTRLRYLSGPFGFPRFVGLLS
ncbi:hypothetical protein Tco_0972120 [Tanacetum coccineum]